MHRLLATACCAFVASPVLGAPPASYEFETGRSATYDVEVEFHEQDRIVSWKGSSTYTVQSVEGDSAQLSYQGNFIIQTRPRNEKGDEPLPPFGGIATHAARSSHSTISGIRLTALGEASIPERSQGLPLPLDPLHAVPLVNLPETPAEQWEVKRESELRLVSTLLRADEHHAGMQPNFPAYSSRAGGFVVEDRLHLTKTITCAAKPDTTEFDRTATLRSAEQVNGKPMLEYGSTGTVAFAKDGFLPQRVDWTGSLTLRTGSGEVTSPVKVSARRLSEEELAERAAASEQARLEARDRFFESLDQRIADLKSGEDAKVRAAAMRLDSQYAGDGDAEIAKVLHELHRDAGGFRAHSLGRALARWATAEQPDLLIGLLDADDVMTRRLAIDRLAEMGTEKAIPAIAVRLRDNFDRPAATAALKKFGSAAEPSMIKMLDDRDDEVRRHAAEVLETIGTGKSLGPLKKAAQEKNPLIQRSAEKAMESISKRLSAPVT
ncbi:MAG: HEAT repeat domain-containing protein [Planctomycetaceae bacterium]